MTREEAIRRIKARFDKWALDDEDMKAIQTLIPELKESEDERIRKEIIQSIKDNMVVIHKDKCLAWLEKLKVFAEHGDGLYHFGNNGFTYVCNPIWDNVSWLEKQGQKLATIDIDKMVRDYANNKERGNEEFGKPVNCMIRAYRQGLNDALSILNIGKQGQKPYGQREECLDCQFNYAGECKGFCAMKRNEQKPTDKIKLKFNIGEWAVWDNKISCHIDDIYQGKESLMYTITDTNNMIRSYSVKGFDNNARHWTIQDAKDGDVLADEYGIYIFNSFDSSDEKLFICKCAYEYSKKVFEIGGMLCKKTDVYPATKEQRELLFQKMHEAGYMWDSDSKQLLSLKAEPSGKQKPAGWSEEDEEIYQNIHECLKNGWRKLPTDLLKYESWFESLKQRIGE